MTYSAMRLSDAEYSGANRVAVAVYELAGGASDACAGVMANTTPAATSVQARMRSHRCRKIFR